MLANRAVRWHCCASFLAQRSPGGMFLDSAQEWLGAGVFLLQKQQLLFLLRRWCRCVRLLAEAAQRWAEGSASLFAYRQLGEERGCFLMCLLDSDPGGLLLLSQKVLCFLEDRACGCGGGVRDFFGEAA